MCRAKLIQIQHLPGCPGTTAMSCMQQSPVCKASTLLQAAESSSSDKAGGEVFYSRLNTGPGAAETEGWHVVFMAHGDLSLLETWWLSQQFWPASVSCWLAISYARLRVSLQGCWQKMDAACPSMRYHVHLYLLLDHACAEQNSQMGPRVCQ